jgi:hypothetical protein
MEVSILIFVLIRSGNMTVPDMHAPKNKRINIILSLKFNSKCTVVYCTDDISVECILKNKNMT